MFEKVIVVGYWKFCVSSYMYFFGKFYGDKGNYVEVIKFYWDFLNVDFNMIICYIGLGDFLFEMGVLVKVRESYEIVIELNLM